jgi:hypothetical protein
MVLVTAGEGALEGWDALDPLVEAVGAQPAALEWTVAGGAEPSVLVSVEATDVAAARGSRRRLSAPRSSASGRRRWW